METKQSKGCLYKTAILILVLLGLIQLASAQDKPLKSTLTVYPSIEGWFYKGVFYKNLKDTAQYKAQINPDKRMFTLANDTLYCHTAFNQPTQYAVYKLSYLRYKGKVYRYRICYFDPSIFWAEQSQNNKKIKLY